MTEDKEYLIAPGAALLQEEREYIKKLAEMSEAEIKSVCPKCAPVFFGIGVMWGGSFHCMRAGSECAIIYGLDIDYETYQIHNPSKIKALWLRGDSRTFKWEDEDEIDFIFVDGDHKYATVKADILNWRDSVRVGGIMAFHDYKPSDFDLRTMPHLDGVRQAVDELMFTNYFEEIGRAGSIIAFRKLA